MVASEHQEQSALIRWADMHPHPALRNLFAIPNGGKRHIATARSMKAEGVRAGVPDLLLAWPLHSAMPSHPHFQRIVACGLFIEMKRRRNGTISAEQKIWHTRLLESFYLVVVARGWDEARQAICDYLGIRA